MRHRIFIAINLPQEVKKELGSFKSKWPELPARWTKKDNLHITLEFLGYVSDEELLKVFQGTGELASKHQSFEIHLNKIIYGPPKKPPRMIWAIGKRIGELNLVPHITLARIRAWDFRRIEPEERPEVNEDIDLTFEVDSIEIMESVLGRGGPTYTILKSFPLKI